MRPNLVLTGFMGSGKSTIGRMAAGNLGFQFVDMDAEIEERHGCTVREIFSIQGEEFFRQIEASLVEELASREGLIISTGGGVVLKDQNVTLFSRSGVVVYLKVDAEVAHQRTRGFKRPLLNTQNPLETITKLMEERRPFYEKIKDAVETTRRPAAEVLKDVLKIYQERVATIMGKSAG